MKILHPVTIVLVGVLCVGGFVLLSHHGSRRSPRQAKTKGRIEKIRIAVQEYKMKYGAIPKDLSDPQLAQFLIEKFSFTDAWGQDIVYAPTGKLEFVLMSLGPDQIPNTYDDIR